eukprot:CAMPEP_0178933560 /NCGR_PEP_ID=MMETSP0786-20121207/23342_1 /TAXON_ID=186022 /ORGANISM="Thalassionema frauenfeldii, Strain CCMP 1798" /LENGTH=378 /DNA_ID=CAMNT_0020611179 /DNA_START=122 /DNA_END=1258 /DNA_ORIENTATION=-
MSTSTVIVGLNGALQKRFILGKGSSLVPGDVHRAIDVQFGVGGKGQDVSISLSCLNYPDTKIAQFVGSGSEGEMVLDLLKSRLGESAATTLTTRTKSPMRTCTTIVATDMATELVEPSGAVTDTERNEFVENLKTSLNDVSALCFMGSMPPGLPDDMYAIICKTLSSPNTLCLIDSVIGLEALLSVLTNRQGLLKINASELCKLVAVKKSSSEAGGIKLSELEEAVKKFIENFPNAKQALAGLALTDGKHPSHLVSFDEQGYEIFQIDTPMLDSTSTLYPVGAGDSVAAGTLACWKTVHYEDNSLGKDFVKEISERIAKSVHGSKQTRMLEASFAFGLACGSASCLCEDNSVFRVDDVLGLFRSIPSSRLVSKLPVPN